MSYLNEQESQILLSAIEKLHSDYDPKTLPQRALDAVSGLFAGNLISFDFFTGNEQYDSTPWHNGGDLVSPEDMEVFARFAHQHPLIPLALGKPSLGALKMTDIVTQNRLERTELYNEFYRQLRIRYQMGVALPVASDLTLCCVVSQSERDFSESEKTILTLARPHLINAVRNALAFERVSSALENGACGIIALDSKGKPQFISEFAQTLFEKYFAGEKRAGNALPESLWSWLKRQDSADAENKLKDPGKPLRIENQHGVLSVRLMFNSATRETTIMLEEKNFQSPKLFAHLPLTRREAEILFWITQGKPDTVIALLCGISARTVQKHLENIYAKLGVENRTSAMLKALEIL